MSPKPAPIPLADRLAKLPPYLFAEIDKWIADGMNRPKRLKMAKPAALAMAEASMIPLE